MACMFFTYIFDAEVVNYKSELDRLPFVFPEAGHNLVLVTPLYVELLFK